MLLEIKSNPKTKNIMREYWEGRVDTRRLDNPMYYPRATKLIQKLFQASLEERVKHDINNGRLWNPVGSYPKLFKELFKYNYRRGGEYSWSYSFVVDLYKSEGTKNSSVRIIIITEEGKGTSLEYLSGDSHMIMDFLLFMKNTVESKLHGKA